MTIWSIPRFGRLSTSASAWLGLAAAGFLLVISTALVAGALLFKPGFAKSVSASSRAKDGSQSLLKDASDCYLVEPASSKSADTESSNSSGPGSVSSARIDPSSSSPSLPRDLAVYAEIDRHALAATPEVESSLVELARYLVKPARSDTEKIRAIFRWVADRITYDVPTFLAQKPGESRPEVVLKTRKCVCDGYANLFQRLCKEVGIEAVVVGGYAKGADHTENSVFKQENHAWNAVKIGEQWHLIDCTWAAGHVNGDKFQKSFANYFFLAPPENLIFTHYPKDSRWTLLSSPPTLAEFEKQPKVDDTLFEYGVTAATLRKASDDKTFSGFVKGLSLPEPAEVAIKEAPLQRRLAAGVKQHFRIDCPDTTSIALILDGKFHFLTRSGNTFETDYTPTKGTLRLAIKARAGNNYYGVVEYQVE